MGTGLDGGRRRLVLVDVMVPLLASNRRKENRRGRRYLESI